MRKLLFIFLSSIAAIPLIESCDSSQDVRLLYWNIQNGMWADQGDDYRHFVDFVISQNPDICVWCEAATIYETDSDKPAPEDRYLPSNWDSLAERYGHQYVYLGGWRDNYPQVITSRFPIRNVKRILGDPEDVIVSHGAAWAQIEIAGKSINIVTLHAWPLRFAYRAEDKKKSAEERGGDKYRRREIEYICSETILSSEDTENEYWMMMGDFNSKSPVDNFHYGFTPDTTAFLVHDFVRNNTPYLDVIAETHPDEFIGSTFGNKQRIDFVYATKALMDCIRHAEILQDSGWLTLERDPQELSNFYIPSDHRPIVIDFKI